MATDEMEVSSVRRDALVALVGIDVENELVVQTVYKALQHGDQQTRYWLGLALGRPRNLQFVIGMLKQEDERIREAAVHALGYMSQFGDQPVQAELFEALHDPAPLVREAAACQLGGLESRGRPALADLKKALQDEDVGVRTWAARATWQIEQDAQSALPVLIEALKDRNNQYRHLAAQTISEVGPAGAVAIPVLIEALNDRPVGAESDKRWMIAWSLGMFEPEAKGAVPSLIDLLGDQNVRFRFNVAQALGAIGPDAVGAVPALIEALREDDDDLRNAAAIALENIRAGDKPAPPKLREALNDR
jgi:HEAT repeat protein